MTIIKRNGFIITEENGDYTMSWMTRGIQDREVTYPLSKELVDKALGSEQDAYEVELFLRTGEWVTKGSKEVARQNYFRSSPVRMLVNPSSIKQLFSIQEFEELIQKAISGLIPTRDYGLNHATGDILGRFDADCMIKPTLKKPALEATENPSAIRISGLMARRISPIFFNEPKAVVKRS